MKLIMTKGLPGSGKSTWAKEQLNKGEYKRVNKDELRSMIDNGKWSGKNEKFIVGVRDEIIIRSLRAGISVISDDTNLDPKHEERFRQIARDFKASLVIEDRFLQVPLETCIQRDLLRLESVGAKVITGMYDKYIAVKHDPPVYDPSLPTAIICDLDGTLALFGNASPYDRNFLEDTANSVVLNIIETFARKSYPQIHIIFLSGREDKFKAMTEEWLEKIPFKRLPIASIGYTDLFMRKSGDTRNDTIVKEELYNAHIAGKYNVLFVLDDRNRVVDLWRRLGLTCLQVAPGDF